ncbi:MAG: ankyrin repeat domain-containing protein [Opitutae bacterium]|nr:ankyrin repeat domain-containing protein [Opitutae bacterium]
MEKEIAEGANINSQNGRDGETPLQRAATRGQLEAAELLVSKGADVNIGRKKDGQTALDLAEDRGHDELAELLRGNGAKSSSGTLDAPRGR